MEPGSLFFPSSKSVLEALVEYLDENAPRSMATDSSPTWW